jgi:elongation factor Tu
MQKYDSEAIIKNCRDSKNPFCDKYRPTFAFHKSYLTTGEITLISQNKLEYGEETVALIRFLTPEVYPKSIWIGKKIIFQDGLRITGYAVVTKIMNSILESDEIGVEGELKMK